MSVWACDASPRPEVKGTLTHEAVSIATFAAKTITSATDMLDEAAIAA